MEQKEDDKEKKEKEKKENNKEIREYIPRGIWVLSEVYLGWGGY